MNNIKIKNTKISLLSFIVGLLAVSASLLAPINPISIPLLLLVLGCFMTYLIFNFIIYPKANTLELIQISVFMLICAILMAISSNLMMSLSGLTKTILSKNQSVSVNPLFIFSFVIFGLITIFTLIKIEKNKAKHTVVEENKKQTEMQEQTSLPESFTPEEKQQNKDTSDTNKTEIVTKIKEEANINNNEKINIDNPKKVVMTEAEIMQQLGNAEQHISLNEAKKIFKTDSKSENVLDQTGGLDLFEQPSLDLNESTESKIQENVDEEQPYSSDIFDADDIPDDIRLIQSQRKKNIETTGVISSIGKLLVNNRDIEHIIETNELMQQIGCNNEEIDVVSMALGIKIYEKFNKIMVDYTQVKDLTLSNKAGFTIASIIKDSRRSETIGAIASSGFVVLNNYLQRLEINNLKKVFFEADNIIYSIFKVDEFIMFFASEKSFNPVNYTTLQDLIEQNNINEQDLSVIKNIKGISESIITNKSGQLIASINSQNPKMLASISSAIFENLKIFISSVDPVELRKITIFTDDKVLMIKKYEDKISSILSDKPGPIKLSDTIVEIEDLMK